jgi:hypothetical protein
VAAGTQNPVSVMPSGSKTRSAAMNSGSGWPDTLAISTPCKAEQVS